MGLFYVVSNLTADRGRCDTLESARRRSLFLLTLYSKEKHHHNYCTCFFSATRYAMPVAAQITVCNNNTGKSRTLSAVNILLSSCTMSSLYFIYIYIRNENRLTRKYKVFALTATQKNFVVSLFAFCSHEYAVFPTLTVVYHDLVFLSCHHLTSLLLAKFENCNWSKTKAKQIGK